MGRSTRETVTIITVLRVIGVLGLTLACTLQARPVWAGPPLITDDPETPGRGGWEINFSHNIEKTGDSFLMETPLVDINYGLLENDQWKIEFPLLFLDPADGRSEWGVGDLLVGWKYRFQEEDQGGWMASIYPQVLAPIGSQRRGLSDGRAEMLLPIELGKHFCEDRLLVYTEVGYNIVFDGSGENQFIYGVAAEWQRTEELELLCEFGGVAFTDGAEADFPFFNIGLKYELTDRVKLIGSAGRSFLRRNSGAPVLITFLGFQLTTPGDRRE